jgi:hypothetical protein
MEYNIALSAEELQVVIGMLNQGPYGQVAPVVNKIHMQVARQNAEAESVQADHVKQEDPAA